MSIRMGRLIDFFYKPATAVGFITIFIIGYLVYLGTTGGFGEKFLHFGPGTTTENTAEFFGMKMDNWNKVITLYVVAFFTALMTQYYHTVMYDQLHAYIFNKAIKEIPFNQFWTYIIVLLEPFIQGSLEIIQFFTLFTNQLQFIIPQFIGNYLAGTPFVLKTLSGKTFSEGMPKWIEKIVKK